MQKKYKMRRMYILSFLFTLHIAISAYINSTFLTEIINEKYVGILYTISSVLSLILLSNSSVILKNLGNRKFILILLMINMLSLVGLITSKNPYLLGSSFITFMTTNTLVLFCIDIFIEHFSDPTKTGKTRGLYLLVVNVAWVLSPIIASFIITKEGGYQSIYLLAFIMVVLMTIGLLFSIKKFNDETYKKVPFLKIIKKIKENKKLKAIIFINFLLQFFYAWMVVYTPIYLHEHLNFDWQQIGIIFTVMLTPFLLFQLPLGILIDKYKLNQKKILYFGFIFIAISTISMSFITSSSLITWALILFLTRVGASIIEATSEIYFFSNITGEDSSLLGIFRDMSPLSYIIAPIIATGIFIFLPFNLLFLILGIILLTGLYFISRLKNITKNI